MIVRPTIKYSRYLPTIKRINFIKKSTLHLPNKRSYLHYMAKKKLAHIIESVNNAKYENHSNMHFHIIKYYSK